MKNYRRVLNIDEAIVAAEKKYKELVAQAEALAAKISAARSAQIKPLETKVNKMLAQVGMPNARIK
jgi:DNA repair protein RecN (Recombination protein N)